MQVPRPSGIGRYNTIAIFWSIWNELTLLKRVGPVRCPVTSRSRSAIVRVHDEERVRRHRRGFRVSFSGSRSGRRVVAVISFPVTDGVYPQMVRSVLF